MLVLITIKLSFMYFYKHYTLSYKMYKLFVRRDECQRRKELRNNQSISVNIKCFNMLFLKHEDYKLHCVALLPQYRCHYLQQNLCPVCDD